MGGGSGTDLGWPVAHEPERGEALTLWISEGSPRSVYYRALNPALDRREALVEFLAGQLGAARALFGTPRPCSIWGTAVRADYIDATGRVGRHRTPDAFTRAWRAHPVGDLAYLLGDSAITIFMHEAVTGEAAATVASAAARLFDSWLHEHALRPEEFAPGRYRGGLVVSAPDIAPVPMPSRATLAAPLMVDRLRDDMPTGEIIRAVENLNVPAVEIPRRAEERERGLLGRFLSSLSVRG